ncbi:MAG: hypothetical protein WBM37_02555, partial [Nitrososphaeraceae archaeon]
VYNKNRNFRLHILLEYEKTFSFSVVRKPKDSIPLKSMQAITGSQCNPGLIHGFLQYPSTSPFL